jgi:hypothetical protein
MKDARRKPTGSSLLGLAFDGSRLEGVEVRRTNGSVEIRKALSVPLSLDPLTAESVLIGREIRHHLDTAGIKERRCAVCMPLSWALTASAKLPELAEEDVESFLQLEAERSFPYGVDALSLETSRFSTPSGEQHATLLAIPLEHITRLEAVLQAAQLRPVSFSLGITALQRPDAETPEGVIALVPGESSIGLQITCGGGVVVLRSVEGAFEQEGSERRLQVDHVARELRITLGQLPAGVRETVRRLRVFGHAEAAQQLAEELRPRLQPEGIKVELVRDCPPGMFKVQVPSGTEITRSLSLAVRLVSGQRDFEFLPPKISQWKQLTAKYSSGKLMWTGAAAGAVVAAVALAFFIQECLLWHWNSKWTAIEPRVAQIDRMQSQIRKYRPWYDESFQTLSILRRLTEAFPEDGAVSAKTIEIRELSTVSCVGTAKDRNSLIVMQGKLSRARGVSNVNIDTIAGTSPLRFTMKFAWTQQNL